MRKIFILVSIVAFVACTNVQGQSGLMENWSISVGTGLSSFYGDVSENDSNPLKKYTDESGAAYDIRLNKFINNNFGVSTQILYGNLKSTRTSGALRTFYSRFLEYNLSFRYRVLKNPNKFNFEAYAGLGQFFFSTTFGIDSNGSIIDEDTENTFKTKTPEFVYFFGGMAYYNINEKISLSMNLGLRQAHNDKMDGYLYPHPGSTPAKKQTWDYYTYTSFGLTYKLGNSGGSSGGSGHRWNNTNKKRKGRIMSKPRR